MGYVADAEYERKIKEYRKVMIKLEARLVKKCGVKAKEWFPHG